MARAAVPRARRPHVHPGHRAAHAAVEPTTRPAPGSASYPGDFTGTLRPVYAPSPDGLPDPGEIVWTWVPYEEDHSRRARTAPCCWWGVTGRGCWGCNSRPAACGVTRVYIVPLIESLALPRDIAAAANPKSSTGRLDVFTRVIADDTRGFDRISAGYHGPLYAEISPRTFPVLVREGSRLSQIRFRRGDAMLDAGALRALHAQERLVDDRRCRSRRRHCASASISPARPDGFVGYRAKRHTGLIDVERRGGYAVDDFWEPISARARTAA